MMGNAFMIEISKSESRALTKLSKPHHWAQSQPTPTEDTEDITDCRIRLVSVIIMHDIKPEPACRRVRMRKFLLVGVLEKFVGQWEVNTVFDSQFFFASWGWYMLVLKSLKFECPANTEFEPVHHQLYIYGWSDTAALWACESSGACKTQWHNSKAWR